MRIKQEEIMKTIITIFYFNIGVDVLGFPKNWIHKFEEFKAVPSRFFTTPKTKTTFSQYES
jgi:hypothetical protein